VAVLAFLSYRLVRGVGSRLSGKAREKRRLEEETELVMSELLHPHFPRQAEAGDENLAPDGAAEKAPDGSVSARLREIERRDEGTGPGGQDSGMSPAFQCLSARSKNTFIMKRLRLLKARVDEDGGFPICAVVNGDLDRTLLRFLMAAEFDVETARENVRDLKKWREEKGIDHILRWMLPQEKVKALRRCMPSSYHGRDKQGHPIHLEQTGHFNWEVLRHCSADDLVKIHILAQEYQSRVLFPRASAEKGYTVDSMCNILDLRGLNVGVLSNLHALNIFKEVQKIDQKYYPGMLHMTYVVNAGWVFRAIWRVLKVVFPAREQSKLRLVPKGEKGLEMLREVIPEEHIPKFLGGSCQCEKGCVSGPLGSGEEPSDNQQVMMDDLNEIRDFFSRNAGREDKYIQKSIRVWCEDPKRKVKLEYVASETVMVSQ